MCGEDVPPDALACPACGADHASGWNEEAAAYDGLDLPDEEFNYEEYLEREFGAPRRPRGIGRGWWIAAIGVLALFVLLTVYGALGGCARGS